jgi:hypothetical protein
MRKAVFGLIGLLVLGLAFMACDITDAFAEGDTTSTDGGGETPQTTKFEGTWGNSGQVKYVFTNNNWRLVREGRPDAIGTFTFTENPNSIRFITTGGGSGSFTYTYEFKNNNSILNLQGTNGPTSSTGDFANQTTKFEGTWKHKTTEVDFRYIFTGNSFKVTNNGTTIRSGTFTFTDTTITFTTPNNSLTQNYTLSENKWELTRNGNTGDWGTFIKQ